MKKGKEVRLMIQGYKFQDLQWLAHIEGFVSVDLYLTDFAERVLVENKTKIYEFKRDYLLKKGNTPEKI